MKGYKKSKEKEKRRVKKKKKRETKYPNTGARVLKVLKRERCMNKAGE